jgi:hypothetical protein
MSTCYRLLRPPVIFDELRNINRMILIFFVPRAGARGAISRLGI